MADKESAKTKSKEKKTVEKKGAKADKPAKTSSKAAAPTKAPVKKKTKKTVPECRVYVQASFNNTIVTITDPDGAVLASSSPGAVGFSGTKKSTAFAATKAAQDAAMKAQKYGIREAKVFIKGPGPGRNAAVKGIDSAGIRVTLLSDLTPLPHNGCRPRKRPRK